MGMHLAMAWICWDWCIGFRIDDSIMGGVGQIMVFLTAYFLGQIQVYLWGEGLVGGFFLGFKFHDSDDLLWLAESACRVGFLVQFWLVNSPVQSSICWLVNLVNIILLWGCIKTWTHQSFDDLCMFDHHIYHLPSGNFNIVLENHRFINERTILHS